MSFLIFANLFTEMISLPSGSAKTLSRKTIHLKNAKPERERGLFVQTTVRERKWSSPDKPEKEIVLLQRK